MRPIVTLLLEAGAAVNDVDHYRGGPSRRFASDGGSDMGASGSQALVALSVDGRAVAAAAGAPT